MEHPVSARLALVLVTVPVTLIVLSLTIGSAQDEEEFRFAILSTWLHVDALRQGRLEFWTSLLGLGLPQPFTPNFNLHPLMPLLGALSPAMWARVLLVAHTLLGTSGMWLLARRLQLTRLSTAVSVTTYLLATPLQNYVLTDFWPSHFVVWTSIPWVALVAWNMLATNGRSLRFWSVACGLVGGLVIASTNPGHIVVYWTVVAAVALVHWRRIRERFFWVAVAALIALAIASPGAAQLTHERPLFDEELALDNVPDPLPFTALANAFLSPVGPESENLVFSRTLFFGGPFVLLGIMACVYLASRYRELVLVFIGCSILLFTPLLALPFVSARFHYRDPLILAAALLGGLFLDRLWRNRRAIAMLVIAAQIVLLYLSAWPAFRGTWIPDARRGQWLRGGSAAAETAAALDAAVVTRGRMAITPGLEEEIYERQRFTDGLGVNALAYRRLPVVNGWFKGVSAASVWPDERMFYGRSFVPPEFLRSSINLNVLGVRYVLANDGEEVAESLSTRANFIKANGSGKLVLWENPGPWGDAVLLEADAADLELTRMPGCDVDRLLCLDLAPLAARRLADNIRVAHDDGRVDVRMVASDRPRLLLVTQMFREDWVASAPDRALATVRIAGALLGVEIPPGVADVELRYRPTGVMVATGLAWSTIAGSIVALLFMRPSRGARDRRHQPAFSSTS